MLSSVSVLVGTTDSFGKEGTAPALTFTWPQDELARVSWDNIDKYRLLDLSAVTIDGRSGLQALSAWCYEGDDGRTLTPRLCGEVYEGAVTKFMAIPDV